MRDLADVLVDTVRALSAARGELSVWRAMAKAAIEQLHEQHREIELQRRQLAQLRDELRAGRRNAA
jgi:hypothetical protein